MTHQMMSILAQFFEKAGFYFVPLLAIVGIFSLRSMKEGIARNIFVGLTTVFLIFYLCFGTGSSRYLLIPLLLWGILAGAGLEYLCSCLHRLPLLSRWSSQTLMVVLAAVIAFAGFLRIAFRRANDVVPVFAQKLISDHPEHAVLYSVGFQKVGKFKEFTSALPDVALTYFEKWDEAIQDFTEHQYENKTFYFFVSSPRGYDWADFRAWFRGCYYVFPFDLLSEYTYRNKRYFLLCFNRKTAEGGHLHRTGGIMSPVLRAIALKPGQTPWKAPLMYIPVQELIGQNCLPVGGFVASDNLVSAGPWLFSRVKDESALPKEGILTVFNGLLWPEERQILPQYLKRAASITPVPAENTQIAEKWQIQPLPSEEPPLVLCPPRIFVPESSPVVYLTGAVPNWRHEAKNIIFSQGEKATVTENMTTLSFDVQENSTGKRVSMEVPLCMLKKKDVLPSDFSMLFIEDSQYKRLKLYDVLAERLAHKKVLMDHVTGSCTPFSSMDMHKGGYDSWPAKTYNAILLNILVDPIVRPWTMDLQSGPVVDEALDEFIAQLKKRYPSAPCFMTLPPPPTDMPAYYPIAGNCSPLSRLSHYRVCDAVQRWYERRKPAGVHLIPLFYAVHPEKDYICHMVLDSVRISCGYYFMQDAAMRFAEIIEGAVSRTLFSDTGH